MKQLNCLYQRKHTTFLFVLVVCIVGVILVQDLCAQHSSWTQKADMPTARTFLSTSVVDGKIYAIGGSEASGGIACSAVEEYDPIKNSWSKKSPMLTTRQWHSTSTVNGMIYAFGGTPATWEPSITMVEEYNPLTDTWVVKTSMFTPRITLSTCVVDNKIYAIGGITRTVRKGSEAPSNVVEVYDPVSNIWTRTANMPTARGFLTTCVIDGKIYAIGGAFRAGGSGLNIVEMYDPATDQWTEKAPMSTARATYHAASVLNGIIYVFGGATGHTTLATVESYDPTTDTWTEHTSMPMTRAFMGTSTVNGKIYAIGGSYSTSLASESVIEEFTPDQTTNIEDLTYALDYENKIILKQNYPNPFSQSTSIQFNLSESGFVTLKVYDFLGKEVKTLVHNVLESGDHTVHFNTGNLEAGMYICMLKTGNMVSTGKMTIIH